MTLAEAFRRVEIILLRPGATPAEWTAAGVVLPACAPGARIEQMSSGGRPACAVRLVHDPTPWYSLTVREGGGVLQSSAGSLLIALAALATESWGARPVSDFGNE